MYVFVYSYSMYFVFVYRKKRYSCRNNVTASMKLCTDL